MDGKRPSRLALGFINEIAVTTAKEDQRCGRLASGRMTNDTDDKNDMIATVVISERRTFEMRERTGDQWRLGVTYRSLDLIPLVGESARELVGNSLLVAREDVDGEATGLKHRGQASRLSIDA